MYLFPLLCPCVPVPICMSPVRRRKGQIYECSICLSSVVPLVFTYVHLDVPVSIYMPMCLFICPCVHLYVPCVHLYVPVSSIYPCLHLYVPVSIYMTMCPSLYPFVHLYVPVPICMPLCPSILCPCARLYVPVLIYRPLCPST